LGLTAHVIITRKPVLLSNAAEFGALPIRRNPASGTAPIESALAVPMIARQRVLGVLSVQSTARQAFSQDDLATLSTLAQQAAIAMDNAALVRNLAAQERLRQEFEIARRTQRDLLPAQSPRLPGWDIAGTSSPASIVGGDFFGYYGPFDSGARLGIAVGDVSGHGMPAALLMTLTVGLLGAQSRSGASPAELLAHLGTALRPHCERSRLNVAVCYNWLWDDGTVCIANAGSIAPLVRRADGNLEWVDVHGLPLGIELVGPPRVERRVRLEPGDALVMMTDGLIEAKNATGEMFGFARLEQALADVHRASAAAMQEHLLKALQAFIAPVEPEDDVTVVVVMKQ